MTLNKKTHGRSMGIWKVRTGRTWFRRTRHWPNTGFEWMAWKALLRTSNCPKSSSHGCSNSTLVLSCPSLSSWWQVGWLSKRACRTKLRIGSLPSVDFTYFTPYVCPVKWEIIRVIGTASNTASALRLRICQEKQAGHAHISMSFHNYFHQ